MFDTLGFSLCLSQKFNIVVSLQMRKGSGLVFTQTFVLYCWKSYRYLSYFEELFKQFLDDIKNVSNKFYFQTSIQEMKIFIEKSKWSFPFYFVLYSFIASNVRYTTFFETETRFLICENNQNNFNWCLFNCFLYFTVWETKFYLLIMFYLTSFI